ncbi:MAG: 3-deoxy-manno-octulosonate cytidylyltransferase [Candidatus Jidaibacter sp.]|jgi:3-deoxy-manno-octulosonate cytidylyltransferase (CMP-KDO synthetase)|nr:3-deoxy-manno-octulosonate cytidylyltransferase [Candidatus Jidaibacter sp.]
MLIFIPVRLAATRLPQKPILDVKGLPMMIQVGLRAKESNVGEVVFACGDQELVDLAAKHGFKAVLTDPSLPTGTDRVHAAYQALNSKDKHILNVQGDMPFISGKTIAETAKVLERSDADMATAASIIDKGDSEHTLNSSVAKVVLSKNNRALYFSRTPYLPHGIGDYYHHLGIYGYKADALKKFVSLPQSPLEKRENLEQLRALENDMTIDVAIVNDFPQSVDTPEDLVKVNQ